MEIISPKRAAHLALLALGALMMAVPAAAQPERWRAEGWRTDFAQTSVPWHEILPGGPPKDGIPAIVSPQFHSLAELPADTIAPQEPVISVVRGGAARAYPLRIMVWHELVNDQMGGLPILVTYCPLCNSALVFERRWQGEVLEFGTTGFLRHSDLIMYDRASESWWQQFTGEAIVGAHTGAQLRLLPSRVESLAAFRARHPQGSVLVPADDSARPYGQTPYVGYDKSGLPFFFQGALPDNIAPMARVVAFESDGHWRAVALSLLAQEQELQLDRVRLRWQAGQNSALDKSAIAASRDIGNVTVETRAENGWRDIPYDVAFAFAFHAFRPESPIITAWPP